MDSPEMGALGSSSSKQAVDDFLASLSGWQRLYIRQQVRNLPIRGLAGVLELPPELVVPIGELLDLQDIFNCRQVSRDWRKAWTGADVVVGLSRFFFPGLVELHGPVSAHNGLFSQALMEHCRSIFSRGGSTTFVHWSENWSTKFFINWEPGIPNDHATPKPRGIISEPNARYQDGMFAWQPSRMTVIIEDLRNKRRRKFCPSILSLTDWFPKLLAVSGTLAVMGVVSTSYSHGSAGPRCKEVIVLHISSDERRRLKLPGTVAHAFVCKDRVTVTTVQRQVISYSWGGRSVELEINHQELNAPPQYDPDFVKPALHHVPGVLFHSTRDDVQFLVWLYKVESHDSDRAYVFVVVKYEGTQPVRRFEWAYRGNPGRPPDPRRHRRLEKEGPGTLAVAWLSCRKINNYGAYTLGLMRHARDRHTRCLTEWTDWTTVCFNVMNESFLQYYYDAPDKKTPLGATDILSGKGDTIGPCDGAPWGQRLLVVDEEIRDMPRFSPASVNAEPTLQMPFCQWLRGSRIRGPVDETLRIARPLKRLRVNDDDDDGDDNDEDDEVDDYGFGIGDYDMGDWDLGEASNEDRWYIAETDEKQSGRIFLDDEFYIVVTNQGMLVRTRHPAWQQHGVSGGNGVQEPAPTPKSPMRVLHGVGDINLWRDETMMRLE